MILRHYRLGDELPVVPIAHCALPKQGINFYCYSSKKKIFAHKKPKKPKNSSFSIFFTAIEAKNIVFKHVILDPPQKLGYFTAIAVILMCINHACTATQSWRGCALPPQEKQFDPSALIVREETKK
jgi:hypothetical protein